MIEEFKAVVLEKNELEYVSTNNISAAFDPSSFNFRCEEGSS